MNNMIKLDWNVGFSKSIDIVPEKRIPAVVPGAVQLDWARAHGWGEYFYADNWKDYLWMEDVYWSYVTSFDAPILERNEKIFFVCKGVDYQFIVKLNGKVVHEQEGMFTPFEIDMTDKIICYNELEIKVFPAPKRKDAVIRQGMCCGL